jgi:hypothetical protein
VPLAFKRLVQRVPCEGGALDACRELAHALKGGNIAKLLDLRPALARQHRDHDAALAPRLFDRPPLEGARHERRAGLGDCAALALKADVGDYAVLHAQKDLDLVPAQGVVPVGMVRGVGHPVEVARALVVVKDDLPVKFLHLVHGRILRV